VRGNQLRNCTYFFQDWPSPSRPLRAEFFWFDCSHNSKLQAELLRKRELPRSKERSGARSPWDRAVLQRGRHAGLAGRVPKFVTFVNYSACGKYASAPIQ
jgi:hypothetical protein